MLVNINTQVVVLAEALWVGKATPYLEYVSIPVTRNRWSLQDGRGLT